MYASYAFPPTMRVMSIWDPHGGPGWINRAVPAALDRYLSLVRTEAG